MSSERQVETIRELLLTGFLLLVRYLSLAACHYSYGITTTGAAD
jgi:hypothetical protein